MTVVQFNLLFFIRLIRSSLPGKARVISKSAIYRGEEHAA